MNLLGGLQLPLGKMGFNPSPSVELTRIQRAGTCVRRYCGTGGGGPQVAPFLAVDDFRRHGRKKALPMLLLVPF